MIELSFSFNPTYSSEADFKVPTPAELRQLVDLFDALGWPTRDDAGHDSERLLRFVDLLDRLEPEARQLVLTITYDYLAHTHDKYYVSIDSLVRKLVQEFLPKGATVVVLPLMTPSHAGRVKSTGAALYPFREALVALRQSNNWTIHAWDRYRPLRKALPNRKDTHILLLDDFVGSGETAFNAVNHFKATAGVASDIIIVCCLVALRQGLEHLGAHGISCAFVHERVKGITDSLRLANKTEALQAMDELEAALAVGPTFRRGFAASEALVTMTRTPNNTFPVYWAARTWKGDNWPSPFTRHH